MRILLASLTATAVLAMPGAAVSADTAPHYIGLLCRAFPMLCR